MFYGQDMAAIEVTEVRLAAAPDLLGRLAAFYGEVMQLAVELDNDLRVTVGAAEITFTSDAPTSAPFYHVAFRLPGDRFDAAVDWLASSVELLRDPDTGDPTFEFDQIKAAACYCHDPAGTILELISYRDLDLGRRKGAFHTEEFLGIAEVGVVVTDTQVAADALRDGLGLDVWTGLVGEPDRLAFVGRRGASLILSPEGRGWLPLGRPAVAHPVELGVTGVAAPAASVDLGHGLHRVASR
jgi:hypothetical protein